MNKELAIGIDLGGTNIRTALVNSSGEIKGIHKQPTHAELEMVNILENMADGIFKLLNEQKFKIEDVKGIGLGAPGFLSLDSGVIRFSPNLPTAKETPVVNLLKRLTNLPVYLENDANAAAIGEHWIGAGQGVDNLLCITIGTGLGSGFILNGKVWHGSNDLAGELGHTTLFPEGLPCNCGRKGCIEAYVSATGIVNRTQIALKEGKNSSLKELLEKDEESLTSLAIYEHAEKGDRLAREIFEETGRYLAICLANVLNMLDLEMIIIGGQVSKAGDLFLRPTIQEIERRAIRIKYYPIKIVQPKLGDHAGIIGAAKPVFDHNAGG
jgi:glucokinase